MWSEHGRAAFAREESAWTRLQAVVGRDGTYYWNTPRHANECNCREDHDEENDPQGAFSRVFDIFPVIGCGLWAAYTVSSGNVPRSGILSNLQEEWGKGWF